MVQSWEDCALTTLLCSLILILNSILNLVSCRKQKKYRGDRKDNLEIIYELPRYANSQNKPKSHPDGKEKVKVTQSCPTLWDSKDCSPPGSSVHGILQARILGWGAVPFSRGSS